MELFLLFSSVYEWENIYFYHKRKKQEISLENIAEIKAALGNVAYTFFDENNNMLFEVKRFIFLTKEESGI